jgi:hypothetical protein
MYDLTLTRLRGCVVQEDRTAAMQVLRVAASSGLIPPRDAVELMLVVRDGSHEMMLEAIDAMRAGVPGSYRYVPAADYAVA